MAQALLPAQQYAPSFEIELGGQQFRHGVSLDVLSVSVIDTSDRADSFSITLRDRHPTPGRFPSGGQLRWMDDSLFDEGAEVTIKLGYVNNLGLEFMGQITGSNPSFPESGVPTLLVRGFSHYQELQRRRQTAAFTATTDSGIASEIAGRLGLAAQVDPTEAENPHDLRLDETYASILSQRAQRIGYEFVVKRKTLYFQKPRYLVQSSPALTLEWGRNLRSFTPTISTYNMATEVKVRASQTSQGGSKEVLVGTARAGDERVKLGQQSGAQRVQSVFGDSPVRSEQHIVASQQEANELALAQLEASSMGYITGRGSCVGDPQLQARRVVELTGLGQRFSGSYYVTSATHTIDAGGYRTDFEVKRNAR